MAEGKKERKRILHLLNKGLSPSNMKLLNVIFKVFPPNYPPGGRKSHLCSKRANVSRFNAALLARPPVRERMQLLTLPGITRLSTPIKSFLSSCSFWKFSILIIVPWSWATISVISANAANEQTATRSVKDRRGFPLQRPEAQLRRATIPCRANSPGCCPPRGNLGYVSQRETEGLALLCMYPLCPSFPKAL